MTDEKNIKKLILAMGIVYDWNGDEVALNLYCHRLLRFPLKQVTKAVNLILDDPSIRKMPLPADIVSKIEGTIDHNGLIMSEKILIAVQKFGYYRQREAMKYLEPIAKEAVTSFGGWETLCRSLNDNNIGIIKAQLRDSCRARIMSEKRDKILTQLPINIDLKQIDT